MADISKITVLNGTTYNIKDSKAYRKGDTAVHKVSSVSAEPQYVSLIENKSTLEQMQAIRALAGVGDYFYAVHNNPNYTVTSNYSGQHGTKGNFALSTLFSPSGASTVLLDVSTIAQTPFVLTIMKNSGVITATDVVHLELYTHTLGNSIARLTNYKVELYTTGNSSPTGTFSWQTVYERSNVSDNPSGLVIPLNPTTYSFLYFSGVRFTIYGATPGSTSSSAWNYNCLDLSLFRLVDQRPAFTAARGIGALDINGGEVYGPTTFYHGITGSLTGTASNASKVNNHTVNSDVPVNAVFTDTKNTAGSTDTSSKIFLVGATSQAANPQTYSHDTAYVGTDGCLYSGGTKVLTAHQDISGKLNTSLKGAANGLAELDANGKVPSAQLPSYVDDVLEYTAKASFPATGETGKIYVDTTTNLTYRWSGSAYVEISPSLALGETSSTAYRGDYGNSAYTHAVTNKGSAFTSGLYKITTNSEGHVTAATAVAKADITGLGIPAQDTTYESKAAASGGTDVSLVTTGEKYNWNTHTHNYAGSTTPGGVANLSAAVPIATVDSTSTSTAFTVQVPEFANEPELRDGLFFFIYNNKVASASGWTLKVNNFDAKPVYNTSAERTTTGFAKTRLFPIWYSSTLASGGCWVIGYLTDANTTYSVFTNLSQGTGVGYLANSVVYRYQLLFQMDETQVTPLNNNSNSTGTAKTMLINVEFDPFGEILYYNTTETISANARVPGGNSLYMANLDLRYSFNCGSTLTAFAPFYLVVDLQNNGKVKLASTTPWSQTLPSTNDGHYYILLGRTYSAYQLSLSKEHPIYYYDGSKICEYMDPKKEPKTVNGHTVLSNVPANAVFTDTLYTSSIDNIGSASVGNPITATAITEWIPNTPTSASVNNGVLTFSLGTAAGLTKTNINVPNISVTSKTVVTEITSSVTGGLPNGDEVSY